MDIEESLRIEGKASLCDLGSGRKKQQNKNNWVKTKEKNLRHAAKTLPANLNCEHKISSSFKCRTLTMQEIRRFHQKFYENKTKTEQDNYILQFCITNKPKRTKTRSTKKVSTNYYIPKLVGNTKMKAKATSEIPKEKRGGKRFSQAYKEKSESVIKFICNLNTLESHYCRNSNITKQYLPSDLTIKTLWNQYNLEYSNHAVKYDYFRNIFVNKFNLSFSSPATDVCSKCLCLKEAIKDSTHALQKRQAMTEWRIHKLRAKAFYEELRKKNDNEVVFSFDCQKNMVLPKIPDQSTYFSRQFYQHNFTICKGPSKSPQSWDKVFSFTWNEAKRPKGSNEIVSAVYHQLILTNFEENVNTVKLFCDGCGGQNKNRSMICMVTKWLYNAPKQIKRVLIIFPTPGHSFIPPDRVFGRIEKEVKRKETILQPDEYIDIFKNYGTVFNLEELPVYNWKAAAEAVFKPLSSWHFKFAPCKQFIFHRLNDNRIHIQGEANYKIILGNPKSIFKRFFSPEDITPDEVPLGAVVKKKNWTTLIDC